ncbi:unnamed protein product, partial [Amoebophrya sp. A120]|eukprot:GSA120T00025648001.1
MKLLLILWQKCFQANLPVEDYFVRNEWMELINSLNGLGLGAASVLGVMMETNANLVRNAKPHVVLQFVDFLKRLGPDATWLNLLQGFCSCLGVPIQCQQQLVLQSVYDPGSIQPNTEWIGNKKKLLLSCRLGSVVCPFPETLRAQYTGGEASAAIYGHTLLASGIRDLFVSWHSSDGQLWQLGNTEKFGLYFSPKQLGLKTFTFPDDSDRRQWVNLADIMWVLDPNACFNVVFDTRERWPDRQKKMSKSEKASMQAKQVLANFFIAQLQMLTEMCLDRQVNAIGAIEKEYFYELVVCGVWHPFLPEIVRSRFAALTDNLWIDRHPHYEMEVPNFIRKYFGTTAMQMITAGTAQHQSELPKFELITPPVTSKQGEAEQAGNMKVNPFYGITSSQKFQLLLGYIQYHMEKMEGKMCITQKGLNQYTGALMEMGLHLLRFGFIPTWDQLCDILEPILKCMDGRTDWLKQATDQLTPRSAFVLDVGPNG